MKLQVQAPEYVTRAWVSRENRFILGNAQPDNCAACGNRCPCDSANRTNGAYDAPLSHMLLRYQPFGEHLPLEVPVSPAGPVYLFPSFIYNYLHLIFSHQMCDLVCLVNVAVAFHHRQATKACRPAGSGLWNCIWSLGGVCIDCTNACTRGCECGCKCVTSPT